MKILTHYSGPKFESVLYAKDLFLICGIREPEAISIITNINKHYKTRREPKKNGTTREINAPSKILKKLQRAILKNIVKKVSVSKCSFGLGKKRTIVENAKMHQRSECLLNLDIQSFFPSIHWTRVKQLYLDLGFSAECAGILCTLTTYKHELPQGVPTSSYLSVLALHNADYRIEALCKKHGFIYTRYFDDISISGSEKIFSLESEVRQVIEDAGYKIAEHKRAEFRKGQHKKVTGVTIKNDGVLTTHVVSTVEQKIKDMSAEDTKNKSFTDSLKGQIRFVKQVNPDEWCGLVHAYEAALRKLAT